MFRGRDRHRSGSFQGRERLPFGRLWLLLALPALIPAMVVLAAVTITGFVVEAGEATIFVNWETASEIGNLGFYVLRSQSESGAYERLPLGTPAAQFVPSDDFGVGAFYEFIDVQVTPGILYYYKVQDIPASGGGETVGPVSAMIALPATSTPIPPIVPTSTATPTPTSTPTATATATPTSTATPSTLSTATSAATTTPSPTSSAPVAATATAPATSTTPPTLQSEDTPKPTPTQSMPLPTLVAPTATSTVTATVQPVAGAEELSPSPTPAGTGVGEGSEMPRDAGTLTPAPVGVLGAVEAQRHDGFPFRMIGLVLVAVVGAGMVGGGLWLWKRG